MVQAILAGRKTQTRRVLKLSRWLPSRTEKQPEVMTVKDLKLYDGNGELQGNLIMKYGKPGDVLWVRETFCGIVQSDESIKYHFKADANWALVAGLKTFWKPSIHMPKEAARLFLRIKDIRVERLKDIIESDAIAEGVSAVGKSANGFDLYKDYREKHIQPFFCAENSFMSLWISINGENSWMSNPWVWVIEFEKIEKPENFLT